MKYFKLQFSSILIMIIFVSCANEPKKEILDLGSMELTESIKTNENLNISFLLDLSDRISPEKYPDETMEYYLRDVAYINTISEVFDNHLRGKKVRQMKDRIQLYFDPIPKSKKIDNLSRELKFNVDRNNISLKLLDTIKSFYQSKPLEIYEQAIIDNKYVGSDTWKFFKNKVEDYCIEAEYRNILVILTDGYIYHKNTLIKKENLTSYLTPQTIKGFGLNKGTWESKIKEDKFGFIPANNDLNNLEVLVLGINPDKKNPYEEDVIKKYWSDWLESMGVLHYEVKTTTLPSDMEKIIKDFINH